MAIVTVNGINKSFAIPVKNTIGRNTMTVESVETKIGAATSFAASSVA